MIAASRDICGVSYYCYCRCKNQFPNRTMFYFQISAPWKFLTNKPRLVKLGVSQKTQLIWPQIKHIRGELKETKQKKNLCDEVHINLKTAMINSNSLGRHLFWAVSKFKQRSCRLHPSPLIWPPVRLELVSSGRLGWTTAPPQRTKREKAELWWGEDAAAQVSITFSSRFKSQLVLVSRNIWCTAKGHLSTGVENLQDCRTSE